MSVFTLLLIIATFFNGLMAGFLFAYAVVIMPGIRALEDAEFIRAFQVTDGIIQNNQPLFMAMWLGSILALLAAIVAALVMGYPELGGFQFWLLLLAATLNVVGIQVSTIRINLPLNAALQKLDTRAMTEEALSRERAAFETRWNRANVSRTYVSAVILLMLLVLLLSL